MTEPPESNSAGHAKTNRRKGRELALQALYQIEITGDDHKAFSLGGDSGSLIVNSTFEAIGLLFAGSSAADNGTGVTYANPIQAVLDALKVDLLF